MGVKKNRSNKKSLRLKEAFFKKNIYFEIEGVYTTRRAFSLATLPCMHPTTINVSIQILTLTYTWSFNLIDNDAFGIGRVI